MPQNSTNNSLLADIAPNFIKKDTETELIFKRLVTAAAVISFGWNTLKMEKAHEKVTPTVHISSKSRSRQWCVHL